MEIVSSFRIQDPNESIAYNKFQLYKDRFNKIIIRNGLKTIILNDISKIDFVGGANQRGRKTDFEIYYNNGQKFNVSLKLSKFKSWESADTLAGDIVAEKILDFMVDELMNPSKVRKPFEIVQVQESGKTMYRIFRRGTNTRVNLAFRCSATDMESVVFGNDIRGQGAVVAYDFATSDIPNSEGVWTFNVASLIRDSLDLGADLYPYFAVRNTSTVRSQYRFPGTRVEAVPRKLTAGSIMMQPLR